MGSYPLFGSNRTTNVENSFVSIKLSINQERDIYRNFEEIENQLYSKKDEKHNTGLVDPDIFLSLITAIDRFGSGLALLGVAGSGKTTAFKQLAVMAAQGKAILGKTMFPIFISVRELDDSTHSLWNGMEQYLHKFEISKPKHVLWSLLKSGQAMILIDGIDETTEKHQKLIIREIVRLQGINNRRKLNKNVICVSGRPFSLSVGLSNFKKMEIVPLGDSQKREFICKWFQDVSVIKGEKLSTLLCASPILSDLSSTPLLLSIVCALYNNELELPNREDELLERAIQGLLGGWDHFRGISRHTFLADLSLTKRQVFISHAAFYLYIKKKIVFTLNDIVDLKLFKSATDLLDIEEIDDNDTLISLYNDFGILIERAPNLYSFNHLAFQEYLTAKYAVESRIEVTLTKYILKNPERYFEVVKHLAKILPRADEFMDSLLTNFDWMNDNLVKLFVIFWQERPVLSPSKRTDIISNIDSLLIDSINDLVKSNITIKYSFTHRCLEVYDGNQTTVNLINALLVFMSGINKDLRKLNVKNEFTKYLKRHNISSIGSAKNYNYTISGNKGVTLN